MRNSFVSLADCSDDRLWTPRRRSNCGERRKRHADMCNRMEAGPDGWNDRRPELATVSGAVPHPRRRSRRPSSGRSRAGPSVRLPVPMVAAVGAKFRGRVKCRRVLGWPKRHESMREPMERRLRPLERPAAKPGHSFFRNAARARAPLPRPREVSPQRLLRAPASQSGSLFPWWQPSAPASRRRQMSARLRPCRLANIRPSLPPAPDVRRTPSYGSTRRAASTTTREPAITGKPARAPICAKLTRARPGIARRGTANVKAEPHSG